MTQVIFKQGRPDPPRLVMRRASCLYDAHQNEWPHERRFLALLLQEAVLTMNVWHAGHLQA